MATLEGVSADALRDKLGEVESAKAAKRLIFALSYLDGESMDVLSALCGIPRSTIHYWLDRFETRSLNDAIQDEPQPGRLPKLAEPERTQLRTNLQEPPAAYGYDATTWTPELVRQHLEAHYGVSYSVGHVRRLLREFDTG